MSENHIHTHVDENENTHTHSHQHPHEQTKAVLNRISRAQGHLEAVRKMIERGEDCAQVLVQLSAVISALNSAGRVILKDKDFSLSITDKCLKHGQRCVDRRLPQGYNNSNRRDVYDLSHRIHIQQRVHRGICPDAGGAYRPAGE